MPSDEDVRLVHRNRGYYDIWVNSRATGVQIRLTDCGDLFEIVTLEQDRQNLRAAMAREGFE